MRFQFPSSNSKSVIAIQTIPHTSAQSNMHPTCVQRKRNNFQTVICAQRRSLTGTGGNSDSFRDVSDPFLIHLGEGSLLREELNRADDNAGDSFLICMKRVHSGQV